MTFTPVWVYLFRLIDYLLFERAVFGFLDHLLVGGDVDFHAAVLRSAFNCVSSDKKRLRQLSAGKASRSLHLNQCCRYVRRL